MTLVGAANDLVCNDDGSSTIKLDAFSLLNAKVTLTGSTTAIIKLTGKLDVELSKASKLSLLQRPGPGRDADIRRLDYDEEIAR